MKPKIPKGWYRFVNGTIQKGDMALHNGQWIPLGYVVGDRLTKHDHGEVYIRRLPKKKTGGKRK